MAPPTKRSKVDQVEEITFDPEARQEYLTGFHKRKQQRIENARDAAAKREKEERVKERKQIREQRKEDLSRHVEEVNAELRKQNPDPSDNESQVEANGEDEKWEGIEDVEPEVAQDEEYVDEDKYTTVTVEAMGDPREGSEEAEDRGKALEGKRETNGDAKAAKKRTRDRENKAKQKKRKFRYESKAERAATRHKQKSKSHAAKLRRTGK